MEPNILDMHLIYVEKICGLFKLAGLPGDEAKSKFFPLYLKGKELASYRLCDDSLYHVSAFPFKDKEKTLFLASSPGKPASLNNPQILSTCIKCI